MTGSINTQILNADIKRKEITRTKKALAKAKALNRPVRFIEAGVTGEMLKNEILSRKIKKKTNRLK